MKILLKITFILILVSQCQYSLTAQRKYGNEWINTTKKYLKLKIAENGIYKVTYEDLIKNGFINNKVDGTSLQLINYGSEKAIFVSNNEFGPGAYFEFYGEKNTIGLDSLLYDNWKKDLFNPEYSLVNDTNAYFLTLSPESSNKRYTLVQPNYDNISLTPFPYYLHEEKIVYSNSFFKNAFGDIRYSNFESSEGFGTLPVQTSNTSLPVSQLVLNSLKPYLEFRTGSNGLVSRIEITWNNQLKETKVIDPKLTSSFLFELDYPELLSNNTLNIKNTYSINDRHRLAYAKLVYPRSFDFNNKDIFLFTMPASASALRLLEISNFKTNNQNVYLYDVEKNIRYSTQVNSNKVKVQINPSSGESKYLLVDESVAKVVPDLSLFTPKTFANSGQEYIIISNKSLYNSGPNYVQEYGDYRSSTAGGNYKTEIVDIQEIYDHFGYGIDRHFMGVKQFAGYMHKNWDKAKFVFIIGKGLEYPSMRTTNDVINNIDRVFFVPTFGYAGSDNMLFSEGNKTNSLFALGRLAATSPQDIKNYLDKITQFNNSQNESQTVENKFWMKKIMHLGGGDTENLQKQIKNSLFNLESIIKKNRFGGDVFSFFKTSSDPIQVATSDQLLKLINNGVSMITFFGHSGTNTFDFALENPNKFNNTGKYHLVNSLGCYAGNIHSNGKSISENFVLEKEKGAIAFIASSGTAFVSDLYQYSTEFYRILGANDQSLSLGQIVNKINEFFSPNSSLGRISLYQQLTFHGDPALKLYLEELPDYTFDGTSAKIDQAIVTTSTEKVNFTCNLVNIGANIPQSVFLRSELFDAGSNLVQTRFDTIFMDESQKSIHLEFSLNGEKSAGINKIVSVIDPDNNILEGPEPGAKQNNSLIIENKIGFEFFVSNNDVRPVFPENFSIVSNNDPQLIAVISDLFAKKTRYYMELDTSKLFQSSFLKKIEITQSNGGTITWKPQITYTPNTVYYWRIAPEPESNEGYQWRNSSFVYLPNSPAGWNQSHFYQLNENKFKNTKINDESRKLEFVKNLTSATIINGLFPKTHPEIKINSDPFRYIRFDNPVLGGVYVSVFNPINGKFWENKFPSLYESTMNSPWASGWGIFPYHTRTTEDRSKLINFLENIIPDGYIVSIFSIQRNDLNPKINYDSDKWDDDKATLGTTLFEVLEKQGITNLRSTIDTKLPFNLVYKKGDKSYLPTEDYAQSESQELRTIVNIETFWNEGTVTSTLIGPSSKWHKLIWSENDKNPNEDITSLNVFGVSATQTLDTLFSNLKVFDQDLQSIDAEKYPFLMLEYITADNVSRTSANLPFWRVLYDGFPELAVDGSQGFEFYKDTLNQGEIMKAKFNVINLANVKAPNFDVDMTIKQPSNKLEQSKKLVDGLLPFQSKNIDFEYNTSPFFGNHSILINIDQANATKDNIKSNNISSKNFHVLKDNYSPLLDVTFDGLHIMNEDIVAPRPQIEILIKDESSFLTLNDLALLEVKLFNDRNIEIPVLQGDLKLISNNNDQEMTVIYTPTLVDGLYSLEIQAKDKSGNKSGANPYKISFRVISKKSVSQVLNYPNPFSSSTQFVFTLTGDEVPENISIYIYTLSGKLVRVITRQELGPLRIGINKTEYKWDGSDEFGSKLANGTYLYKVNITDKEGKNLETYTTKADNLFKEGFGKMVIIR